MISVDHYLAKATQRAQTLFGSTWGELCQRFGPPREHSPLSSVHFLLTEYSEPPTPLSLEPYKHKMGPHEVESRCQTLDHDQRHRATNVQLTYPKGAIGSLPTLVLSPGLGAHPNASQYLEYHLASHGYLVIRPTHRGSDWLAVALKTPLGAFTRVEFARRVEQLERSLQALFQGELGILPLDDSVAIGGHSFGALTSAVVAGLPAGGISIADAYPIKALVAISPYGDSFPTRRLKIDCANFRQLTVPTLFMSGTRDTLFTLGKGANSHLEPFYHSGSSFKKHLVIGNTRHGNFSQVFGWVKSQTKVMVNSTISAFLDAHLQSDDEAQRYLQEQLAMTAFNHNSWVF